VKLIRCNECGDVINLCKEEWRRCYCKESGGQYNEDNQTVIVGGKCEVIGIRNDYFDYKPFSKERTEDNRNIILQGEYEGDLEVKRVKSSRKPRLNLPKITKP
jgi:hypothetical protein